MLLTAASSRNLADKTPTTDMEVTSIRLERELKEKLKELAQGQGYQALIRDILWEYIQHRSSPQISRYNATDICASFQAIAQQEYRCVLTGKLLLPQESILLGLTTRGELVPLSIDSMTKQ